MPGDSITACKVEEFGRNYEAALRKVGATELRTDANGTWWVNAKVVKDGREVWARAEKGNGTIWLRIVEKQGMQQYVVAGAAALRSDIKSSGHVAVYGITFDTNRAEVRTIRTRVGRRTGASSW